MFRFQQTYDLLKRKKVHLLPGLSNEEVLAVEATFGFRFPPDYRQLLQEFLPVSDGLYDWRKALTSKKTQKNIREMLAWPLDGILFDIEYNEFWVHEASLTVPAWGPCPPSLEEKFAIAAAEVSKYSKLIPIYGHRYIPESPHEAGNPIFSVYQTDIIYYGSDLENYFLNEFLKRKNTHFSCKPRYIPFWSDIADGKYD